jgi:aldehyde dehydrogenase (NAD+)
VSHDPRHFYIDGQWVPPAEPNDHLVVNPATEEVAATISLGGPKDVDRAVAAARRAFEGWAAVPAEERRVVLERVLSVYKARLPDVAQAISTEMGAPITLATKAQAATGVAHLSAIIEVLKRFPFEEQSGTTRTVLEPVGVCGLITPWNWPVNQVAAKVVPALAAGCTVVLKPSELAPLSAGIWAEVLHEAGVPAGVFNLVNGLGPTVGAAIAAHPGVDMVSFTGSTRAGIEVARAAAPSVKRVHQELGGKSPNVILDDADLPRAVKIGIQHVFLNSGQSCDAPTRMLVPEGRLAEVEVIAKAVADAAVVGDPRSDKTGIGPVVSKAQHARVQGLIEKGVAEGARVVAGGPGRPPGLERGFFVRPTIFSNVRNDMTIAREEIFGPVLCILPYRDEDEAVRIANDTPYGLAAYVWSGDLARARRVAARIRAGQVHLNGAPPDFGAPFGGYKQSGNGREWGAHGLREFLEVKAILGVPLDSKSAQGTKESKA